MLRDDRPYNHTDTMDDVWPVLNRGDDVATPKLAEATAPAPFRAAPAAPDVPASLGAILFAAYMALIGAFALATAAPGETDFALVIAALFVAAFFAVPRFIFAQEPQDGRRPTMRRFLAQGMSTYTGHCSGRDALVQILIVPVLLTLCILAIGIEIALLG